MAACHLSMLFNFFSLFDFCWFLLLNGSNGLEANSIYQQKTWSLYDLHHLQRCSAWFYYINFRVTSRHTEVHTNLWQNLPVIKVSKHGITTLVLPSRLFYTDLMVNMDVEANPGPEVLRKDKTPQRISTLHNPPVNYSRSQLLNLRTKYSIPNDLFYFLKDSQILRTWGIRAGLSLGYEHWQISAFGAVMKL